jgi:DNA-binding response OmpR family regulator
MGRSERQRFLPYEDGGTKRGSDARHWLAIYRELVAFQEEHLARLEATTSLDRHWRPRAEATQQLDWLRARSAFWLQRCIVLAGLVFQPATRRLEFGEHGVTLTRREAELFEVLVRQPGQYFGADRLINQAWSGYQLSPEQLRVYVWRLRRRLVQLGTTCRLVHEPGLGYGLVLQDD